MRLRSLIRKTNEGVKPPWLQTPVAFFRLPSGLPRQVTAQFASFVYSEKRRRRRRIIRTRIITASRIFHFPETKKRRGHSVRHERWRSEENNNNNNSKKNHGKLYSSLYSHISPENWYCRKAELLLEKRTEIFEGFVEFWNWNCRKSSAEQRRSNHP